MLLSVAAAYLFYRSIWGICVGVIIVPIYVSRRKKQWQKDYTNRLQQQFISGMQMVSGSLMAGYSMENAWKKAEEELSALYGADAEFCVQMRYMNQRLSVNEPLERILSEFAASSRVEEIWQFSEVFSYTKRSGGNIPELIQSVTRQMHQKAEVLTEIESAVASQKMEQKMMNLLLPGILFFVTISSPSYVSTLYHNAIGVFVMSICLVGYLCCMFWSERLSDIPV